jgi:hypothetical protein
MGPWVAANGAVAMLLVLDVYGAAAARRPEVLPYGGRRFEQAISGSWMLLYLPLALLLLTFPDGRLPGRGWRLVSWALPGVALAFNALVVTGTLATGTRPVATALATPLPGVLLLLLLACGASVVVRYRRGDAATRVRLRWILLAGATVPLTLLLCWASYLFLGESDLVVLGLFAMFLAVPTAATTALLRGDRVDVDSVIVSTAAYAVIGAGLLAVLSATSAVAGLLVARVSTTAASGAGSTRVASAPWLRWRTCGSACTTAGPPRDTSRRCSGRRCATPPCGSATGPWTVGLPWASTVP